MKSSLFVGIVESARELLDGIDPEFGKSIYALSLYIAGPFAPGQDQDQGHPRYFKDERPLAT